MKPLTKAQRAELKQKYGGHCAYCGVVLGDRWHADHFEAIQRKIAIAGNRFVSTNECYRPELHCIDNMMPACAPCNINKSVFDLETWRGYIAKHVESFNAHSAPYRIAKAYGLVVETGLPVAFYFEQSATHRANTDQSGKDE